MAYPFLTNGAANREGARAESIMREHSRIAQRNLSESLRSHNLDRMPGVRLNRKRG